MFSFASRHSVLGWVALAVWLGVTTLVGGYTLAPHLAGLPVPSESDPAFTAAVRANLGIEHRNHWVAIHVMLVGCDCSRRILEVLSSRPPLDDAHERVVLVGRDPARSARLSALGYSVEQITPADLRSRYHLETAPLFVVVDPSGMTRYVGGYTEHRRGADLLDRDILASAMAADTTRSLPVLGCAASPALRNRIDPLGLRPGPTAPELVAVSTHSEATP